MSATAHWQGRPTFITEQIAASPLSCLMVWFASGRLHEPMQAIGASEIFEKEFIRQHLDWALSVGGCVGVNTNSEHAYHYVLVSPQHLDAAIERLAVFYEQTPLNEAQFAEAKRELYRDYLRRLRFDDFSLPEVIVGRHFPAFPGNTYTERFLAIEGLTYEAYREFRHAACHPSQLIIAAVGANDPEAVRDRLSQQLIFAWAASDAVPHRPLHLPVPLPLPNHACQNQHTAVGVGFRLQPLTDRDETSWQLLNAVLEMRQDRLLDSYLYAGKDYAYWLLLSRKMDGLPFFPVDEVVRETSAILRCREINPQILLRAKNMAKRQLLETSEGLLGTTYHLCMQAYRHGGTMTIAEICNKRQVELQNEAVVDVLQGIALQTPEYVAVAPDFATSQRLLQSFIPVYERHLSSHGEGVPLYYYDGVRFDLWQSVPQSYLEVLPATNPNSTSAGNASSPAATTQAIVHQTELGQLDEYLIPFGNGLQVLALHHPQYQLDYFGLYLKGGRIFENQYNCGISHLLFSSVLASFSNRLEPRQNLLRASALNKGVEWLGGYLEADVTADISGVRGMSLSHNLPRVLEEVSKGFFHPRLPDGMMLQHVKQALYERTKLRQRDLFHRSVDMFYQTVYGVHPYGLPRFGNERTLNSLTVRDLHDWHDDWVHPQRTVMVMLTSRSVAEIKEVVGAIKTPSSPPSSNRRAEILSLNQHARFGSVVELENRDDRQSALVMGFPVPFSKDNDLQFKIDVLQNILSGPGGLLMNGMMSGATPGLYSRVKSFYVPLAKGGVFFLYVEFNGKDPGQVRDELHRQLKSLLQVGISDVQLQRAKQFAIGSHQIAMMAPLHRLYELGRCQLLYGDPTVMSRYTSQVLDVTAEQLQETARQIINPERFTAVAVKGAYEMA